MGYGDIVPTNNVSRLVIVLTLGVTFTLLPTRFAKLSEVLNQQSMFARSRYTATNRRHVVVTGHLSADSLSSWLREFFHEARRLPRKPCRLVRARPKGWRAATASAPPARARGSLCGAHSLGGTTLRRTTATRTSTWCSWAPMSPVRISAR